MYMNFILKEYDDIREKVEKMSVRQLLKAVACPQTQAENTGFEKGFAGVFLHSTTKEKARAFVRSYNSDENSASLICSDTECGAGDMLAGCTKFSSMLGMGIADDSDLAYKVGQVAAKECVEVGYRWSLSPCVDIVFNDESPMASTRCAGETADTVIKIAGAYMRGLQDGGVAATIKHFPGDGAAEYDQHLTTVVNPLSREEWMESYGKVYRELIEQGAMCIMPGHISLPCYDTPDADTGISPPATLSYPLMTTLLRKELGFEGLICSDALCMGGFAGFMNYYKACATYLKNGGDMMLFVKTSDRYYEKMEALVESGYLPLEVLKNRACRCLSFVRQVTEEMEIKPETDIEPEALSKELTKRSLRIVRDRNKILPHKSKGGKILVLDFSVVYTGEERAKELYNDLQREGYNVEFLYDPGNERLEECAESGDYELIICTIANQCSFGTNVLKVHGKQARNFMGGWTKLGTPCVFVCFHHPYFHKYFETQADTVINTYGVSEYTNEEIIKAIFGK